MFKNPEDWFNPENTILADSIKDNIKGHILYDMVDRFVHEVGRSEGPSEWQFILFYVHCSHLFEEYHIPKLQAGWLYLGEMRGHLRMRISVEPELSSEIYFSRKPELFDSAFDSFISLVRQFLRDVVQSEQKNLLN